MRTCRLLVALLLFSLPTTLVQANPFDRMREKGWTFELRAGCNLGGVTPIPLPAEVRKIEHFNPRFNAQLELTATNWMQEHIGLSLGLRFEQMGMETKAQVKNYKMELINEGAVITGVWTGRVQTTFSASYLTLPLQMVYRFNDAIKFSAGTYFSWRFDGDFHGVVSDGHFRRGSSTGETIVFDKDTKSPYTFKDYLSPISVGIQLGGSARVYKNLLFFADMKYGLNGIFKKNFKTLSFAMHPFYLGTGFAYRF